VTKTKSGGNSSAVLRLALRPLRPSASSDDSFRSHVVAPVLATIRPKLPADIALLGKNKKSKTVKKTVKGGNFDVVSHPPAISRHPPRLQRKLISFCFLQTSQLSKELVSKVIVFAGGRKVTSEEVSDEVISLFFSPGSKAGSKTDQRPNARS